MAPSEDSPVPDGLVEAIWCGPYPADMGEGQPTLQPGDTFHITPDMADSEHWEVPDEAALQAAKEYFNEPGDVDAIPEQAEQVEPPVAEKPAEPAAPVGGTPPAPAQPAATSTSNGGKGGAS